MAVAEITRLQAAAAKVPTLEKEIEDRDKTIKAAADKAKDNQATRATDLVAAVDAHPERRFARRRIDRDSQRGDRRVDVGRGVLLGRLVAVSHGTSPAC